MLTVSVVIPYYNAERWICQTLQSVYDQAVPDCEIIVVDDGSNDKGSDLIAAKFPDARLIRTSNRGPSHARNIGTRIASGRYIQYLDADDLLAPGKLMAQVHLLEQSKADVAYGDWQRLEEQVDGSFYPGRLMQRLLPVDAEVALFTYFWCPPAAYLFRRSIVERVGRWKEHLPVIQDARFALDCALHGGRFVYSPGLMAWYRVHRGASVSRRDPVAFHRDIFRNAIEVEGWWKRYGGIHSEHRAALLRVYSYVAYVGFDIDASLFAAGYQAVIRLSKNRPPAHLYRLAFANRIMGIRYARLLVGQARHVLRQIRPWKHSRLV